MTRKHGVLLLALVLAAAAPLFAAAPPDPPPIEPSDYIQSVRDGYIDWGAGVVAAWGRTVQKVTKNVAAATADNRHAAEVVGKARLLAIVQEIRADAESRIVDRKDVLERVSGIVRGARILEEREGRGPFFEVLVEAPLRGVEGIAYTVYSLLGAPAGGGRPPGADAPQRPLQPIVVAEAPTGILIDARGTGLEPALLPRIVDEEGRVVASAETADPGALKEMGVVAYGALPPHAGVDHPRVGSSPLVIRASAPRLDAGEPQLLFVRGPRVAPRLLLASPGTGAPAAAPPPAPSGAFALRRGPRPYKVKAASAGGTLKADIVLSRAEADRLEKSPGAAALLKECRVLVIVESPVGGVEGIARPGPAPAGRGLGGWRARS